MHEDTEILGSDRPLLAFSRDYNEAGLNLEEIRHHEEEEAQERGMV
jgi:hypothetical protein